MIARLLDLFTSGATVFLPGATAEVTALAQALANDPGRMVGVDLVSCVLPGINRFDYAALASDATLTCFLMAPHLQPSFGAGRVRLVPLAYSGIVGYLQSRAIDIAVAHVAPPSDGRASLGIAADFTPIAWQQASRRVAIINPNMGTTARTCDRLERGGLVDRDRQQLDRGRTYWAQSDRHDHRQPRRRPGSGRSDDPGRYRRGAHGDLARVGEASRVDGALGHGD